MEKVKIEKQKNREGKKNREKVKKRKMEKVISILENDLISDFVLKSASAAAVLFVLFSLSLSWHCRGVSAYIQLYTMLVMLYPIYL